MISKVRGPQAIGSFLGRIRSSKKSIVFTNGCFDILHVGHIRYLRKAKSLGDVLIVALNSDRSVSSIKPGRPINCQRDRAEILSALPFVDCIVIFDEDTPEKLIRKVRPDVLVKGGDWRVSDIAGSDFVKSCGGIVKTIPFVKGYSTTKILKMKNHVSEMHMK